MDSIEAPEVGEEFQTFRPLDNAYYPGFIAGEQNGNHTVAYNDVGIDTLDFSNQKWLFQNSSNLQSMSPTTFLLKRDMPAVLPVLLIYFGSKTFLPHLVAGFPQFAPKVSYAVLVSDFKNNVKLVSLPKVPENANIISSHVFYKI